MGREGGGSSRMAKGASVTKFTGSKFEVVFTLARVSIGARHYRALGDCAGWGVEEMA